MKLYKSTLLFIGLVLSGLYIQAQNSDFELVKNSNQYIWGYGQSEDYDIANKHAMEDLLSKISVHVESNFEYYYEQEGKDFKEYSRAVMNTYSNATLTGIKQLKYVKRGVYYILRYVKKEDLEKMFSDRTQKIRSYYTMGLKAERENRIGDALRYFYWSYALWLSHPYRDEIKETVDGSEVLLGVLLQDKMNAVFSDLKFQVVDKIAYEKENKTKLILQVTFHGKPVENLDYRYSLGGNVSAMQEVNHGLTEVYLYGEEQKLMENLRIGVEYKYLSKSYQDKDLSAVLNTVKIPFFKKSRKKVRLKKRLKPADGTKPEKLIGPKYETVNRVDRKKTYYVKTVNSLLVDIAKKDFEAASAYFTPEGRKMFDALIKNGNVSVFPVFDTLKIVRLNDVTMVRSVPMSFYFPGSDHQYIENVVFSFDSSGMISEISFAVDNTVIKDILRHSSAFGSVNDKYTLIRFMESYKTAYSLKRLDYIESVFSDDALIIVGTMLKRKGSVESMMKNIGDEAVRYQRLTKREYLERLQSVFARNEYINLDFDEAKVKKVNGEDKIYGIQIAQHYNSASYSDFGYLFLMIDLNDSLNPTIYVRTWQPEKNPDGSIYGLEDFQMN